MFNERKRLRYLEIYAVVSMIVLFSLVFSGFMQPKQKFGEIDVERLNVIDKNGQLRVVIANSERMPDPVIDGYAFKTERPPGILFFNGLGDENGGLISGAVAANGKYGAYQGLSFDKYKQAQAMALVYNDKSGKYRAGLQIWDRSETSLATLLKKREQIKKMPDGADKDKAFAEWEIQNASPTRVYVGKNADKEAEIRLADGAGNVRIRMKVPAEGEPRLEFLDKKGTVVRSLKAD